jgi:hypothetical protein
MLSSEQAFGHREWSINAEGVQPLRVVADRGE